MIPYMIFFGQAISQSIEFFLWMLGAFLIGYFFARYHYQKDSFDDSDSKKELEEAPEVDIIRPLTAIKTMERGGVKITAKKPKSLNFERLGKATASQKNDLKIIKGIGALVEEKLNTIGVYTYAQIALFSEEDTRIITKKIQLFPGKILRDQWIVQAKKLSKEKD